ncbi:MAG: VanW family protein [Actinobacteria bacterium]|nr:VanW family protein [Actinomycetota bacterium]
MQVGVARRRTARTVTRWLVVVGVLAAVLVVLVGFAFAGSDARLAEGVEVAGVDVSGLTTREARALLESRAEKVARVPIVFTVGEEQFPIKASSLGVKADWRAALDTAAREGQGFGPVRGFKRLQTRLFGAEISPPVQAYTSALDYKLGRMADDVDRRHVEAKLVRRGLSIVVVPGQTGLRLDREAAADAIVRALATFERGAQVPLPVRVDPVEVTAAELGPAARGARTALSDPVRLTYGPTRWKLPRWRIAKLLSPPKDGETTLAIEGNDAEAWFAQLKKTVERPPVDATFAVGSGQVRIIPGKEGLELNVPATAKALLAAATRPANRTAELVLDTAEPDRTTGEAQAMGIERRLGTYSTLNAGTSDRITNLRRAVDLLHGALVRPGGTFSLNDRVGERTVERGFRSAPVIIQDEYEEAVGGGVSQVATTVFNAAWESGVKILERNPHSLYISRYQLGRDATVNYPDLDLKFLNDTPSWIFVAGSWDAAGITVSLYGGGPERRVVSSAGTMRITGPPRVRRTPDPTLEKGKTVVEEEGSPSSATSVDRTVYAADGSVLHDETWNTSYRGEYRVIRVGTKPKPAPKPKPAEKKKPGETPVETTEQPPAAADEPVPTPTQP